jgi:hypothetical protein
MLSYRQFLEEQKTEYYFHGTTPDNASSALEKGLDPSKSKYGGRLFLTKNHGEAQRYSKAANNGEIGKVLMIPSHALDKNHVVKDHAGIVEYSGKIHQKHIKTV